MASLKTYLWKNQWDKTKNREKEHTQIACLVDDQLDGEVASMVISVSWLIKLLQRHSSCFHDILTNPPIACVNFLDLDRVIGPLDKARTSSSAGLSRSSSSPLANCLGDFGPRGLYVQYTQDVRCCPCVSVWVRVCPCVSVSTHRTSVAVHQYTYQHAGPWTQHVGPSRGFGTHRTSVAVRVCPSAHLGRPCVSVSTHRTSVGVRQHTQDVRVCPSVSVSTHRTSVAVHQYTYQHVGPWTQHAGPSRGLFRTSVAVHVCPSVSVSTHSTSVAVHQYINQHVGPWTQYAGPSRGLFGMFPTASLSLLVIARVIGPVGMAKTASSSASVSLVSPSSSLSTSWSMIISHRPSVGVLQHRQDVYGCPCVSMCVRLCPSAHTGHPWLSISTHISTLLLELSMLALPVDCSGDFCPRGLPVQYTQDVRGCPPAHTGRLWVSVCVHVCQSAHTGHPWLSISTHISTLVLGLSTLALPVGCSGDFGPRGLSVQYTQDVRVCPSAHTGRSCVSVSTQRTSVAVRQHTHNVRGCPSVHISARWSFPWLILDNHRLSVDCRSVHIAAG
ncbi:hypothetical protein IGI04_035943 [Brassica rapa subsp. trilocularis]|uniref:Uncharacterized protein n=1 Tax=Brassica rapa subsp. trilocularis TaxID=1813537 RepID=A0ABQ7LD75_BRACM|nr:hypothetical protein IGI04_035943 [Brassica rapa subsp. trilocularis]